MELYSKFFFSPLCYQVKRVIPKSRHFENLVYYAISINCNIIWKEGKFWTIHWQHLLKQMPLIELCHCVFGIKQPFDFVLIEFCSCFILVLALAVVSFLSLFIPFIEFALTPNRSRYIANFWLKINIDSTSFQTWMNANFVCNIYKKIVEDLLSSQWIEHIYTYTLSIGI